MLLTAAFARARLAAPPCPTALAPSLSPNIALSGCGIRQLGRRDRSKGCRILRAIEDGLYDPAMKARLSELKAERDRIVDGRAVETSELDVMLHPQLPEMYRRWVERLERVLEEPDEEEVIDAVNHRIGLARAAANRTARRCG